VRHAGGVSFCAPIGHRQEDGDYRESWQPQPMSPLALAEAQRQAATVTGALGGWGVFGVEFFVQGDSVIFSEVSPRPHDTGLVTLISQELSEFALHARAILGLPIPVIHQFGPSASCAVLVEGNGSGPRYHGVADALAEPDTQLRLFGKPTVSGRRRMAVTLARADTLEAAIGKAVRAKEHLRIEL
jgi:phosphoribosylglycinamide formyltransferase 2